VIIVQLVFILGAFPFFFGVSIVLLAVVSFFILDGGIDILLIDRWLLAC